MKTLTPQFVAELQGPVTHLCRCLKIIATNGAVYALTDLDVDLTIGGVVYRADIGLSASNIAVTDGTQQSSVDAQILLNDSFITRELCVSGLFDGAKAALQIVDWQTLDVLTYYAGKVRHITFSDKLSADFEIASILDPNLQVCFDLYSYTCRVDLGSPQCGVPIGDTAKQFTVTAVTDKYLIQTDLADPDNYWIDGLVSITSGANKNVSRETSGYNQTDGTILLKQAAPFPFAVGDVGTIYRGCNKTPADCNDKWHNMPNYRGEPTGIPKVPPASLNVAPPTTVPAPPGTGGSGGSGSGGGSDKGPPERATPAQARILQSFQDTPRILDPAVAFSVTALVQCFSNNWLTVTADNYTIITPRGARVLANTVVSGNIE